MLGLARSGRGRRWWRAAWCDAINGEYGSVVGVGGGDGEVGRVQDVECDYALADGLMVLRA